MKTKITMKSGLAALVLVSLVSSNAFAKTSKEKATPAKKETARVLPLSSDESKVLWLGKKVTGAHNGTIRIQSGQIEMDGKQLKGGQIAIDMNSIVVDDLKDPDYNGKLVGHLKSDDFFGVDKNPVSSFKITSVKAVSGKKDTTHEISGDLTIKGVTHPISFPALVEVKNGKARAKASLKVDRTKYNIRYGSGRFFENLGDKMINDEFQLDLDIVSKI